MIVSTFFSNSLLSVQKPIMENAGHAAYLAGAPSTNPAAPAAAAIDPLLLYYVKGHDFRCGLYEESGRAL